MKRKKKEYRKLHKQFVKENKTILRLFDISMIIIILLNFGNVFITNYSVTKEKPVEEIVFREINPIMAERAGLEKHTESKSLYNMFVFVIFIWSLILSAYIYLRMTITSKQTMFILLFVLIFGLMAHITDLMSNLGLIIGKLVAGG